MARRYADNDLAEVRFATGRRTALDRSGNPLSLAQP